MIIKNRLSIIILTCLISLGICAQAPNWQVDENEFEYTMTMVAFLNINATNLSSTNDKLGAFVNNESRGVANLIYVASTNGYYAYLTVFANSNSETINFKIYDSTNNTIIDADQVLPFEINKHYGGISSEFGFSNPTPKYFKKNVLPCDISGGAIKVAFGIDNIDVTLEKDNLFLQTKTSKGEALFENIEIGTYLVKINNIFKKTIKIELEN
jgi:hypothetical protein